MVRATAITRARASAPATARPMAQATKRSSQRSQPGRVWEGGVGEEGGVLDAGVREEVMKRRQEGTRRIIKIVGFWQRARGLDRPKTLCAPGVLIAFGTGVRLPCATKF